MVYYILKIFNILSILALKEYDIESSTKYVG